LPRPKTPFLFAKTPPEIFLRPGGFYGILITSPSPYGFGYPVCRARTPRRIAAFRPQGRFRKVSRKAQSTKGQAKDGNSLEAQEAVLREHGAVEIYKDAFTGTKASRPQFDELMKVLKVGDTLMVTKLDRFARSMTQGSELVNELINKGITVTILNIGTMDNTPASKLIRNIFFSFAEFERDMIVERTQEGKEIAKQRDDFKEGRPNTYTSKQIEHALSLLENNSYKQVEQMTGISKSTLIRAKRKLQG
jgi:DNA invertase Pin-like site-specific DNA recombinase